MKGVIEMIDMLFGIAKVTEKGIYFHEQYYSSAEAISGKWFESAALTGGWYGVAIYDPKKPETIFFVNENENNVIQCDVIQSQIENGDKLENYFKAIQELKKARRARERTHRSHIQRQRDLF